jgi:(p)ppGpp synthase/HD superfamily hydrolase
MNRRLQLINWVKTQHSGQLIKETDQPYFEHVLNVANMAADAAPLTYEIGLCHDLIEKTNITKQLLSAALTAFGYDVADAIYISDGVSELTRHFTKDTSPLPKKIRKDLEDERLLTIKADAQTVKYADLLYNAEWMMRYDRHHAKDYIKQKIELVNGMIEGDAALRKRALLQFYQLLSELSAI